MTPPVFGIDLAWVDAVGGDHRAAIALTQLAAWTAQPGTCAIAPRGDGLWLVPTDEQWHATTRLAGNDLTQAISILGRRNLVLRGRWAIEGVVTTHVRLANPAAPTEPLAPLSLVPQPAKRTAAEQQSIDDALRLAEARRLCDLLADLVEANGVKRPTVTDTWVADMDKIIRLDGREPDRIERAIRWVQADKFWAPNVMCPAKLRKQYSTLQLQARNRGSNSGSFQPAPEADLAASYGAVTGTR